MVAIGSCGGVDASSVSVDVAPSVRTATVGGAVGIAGTPESVVSTSIVDSVETVAVEGVAPTAGVASAAEVVNATGASLGNATAVWNAGATVGRRKVGCASVVGATFSGDGSRFCGTGTIEKELAESTPSRLGNALAAGGGSL